MITIFNVGYQLNLPDATFQEAALATLRPKNQPPKNRIFYPVFNKYEWFSLYRLSRKK